MKKMLISNIILSVIDAGATAGGIISGYIREANPVVSGFIMKAPIAVSSLVCLLSVLLLILIYNCRDRIRWVKSGLSLVLAVKLIIICLHISSVFLAVQNGCMF